ncbi:hypothetical protein M407DRAFT_19708 [Tulasnella calospora MUT 4182]|uniref:Uncharacterized protein n=1 Tax=Tulasnella calospora MUT 4182 TaxID=1051891 RepID=A0A0C3LBS9_9AGAM|nr:hypothetical protein M407DRAFT_19708 [Tulasnella calospora MUT 4182]
MPHCELVLVRGRVAKRLISVASPRKEKVDSLKEKMKQIQREETEEDAKSFSELVLEEMRELVTKEAKLEPEKERFFKDHWDKAEANKQKFLEKAAKEKGSSRSSFSSKQGSPITLNIRINVGDPRSDLSRPWERQLTFPHYFRDSYLSALVPYALARDQSQAPQRSPGPGARPLPVIKRQPMDALYVRSVDGERRARWNLIDRGRKMTVKEYERLTRQDPTAEVRFISCRIRFVVLTVYNAGKNVERVIDIDKDQKQLLRILESQDLRGNGPIHSTQTRRTRGRGPRNEENPETGAGRDLLRTIKPQTCLFILGEDPFAPITEDPMDKGCQCVIC